MIESHWKEIGKIVNPSSFVMAEIPVGAKLIPNSFSGAPGFSLENVYVLAGVPDIAQSMFFSLKKNLKRGKKFISKNIKVFVGESRVKDILREEQYICKNVQIGSYPFVKDNNWNTTIVVRGQDVLEVDMVVSNLTEKFRQDNIEFLEEK